VQQNIPGYSNTAWLFFFPHPSLQKLTGSLALIGTNTISNQKVPCPPEGQTAELILLNWTFPSINKIHSKQTKLSLITHNSSHMTVFPSLSKASQVLLSPGKMKVFQKSKSYNSQKSSVIFGKQPGKSPSSETHHLKNTGIQCCHC